MGGVPCNDVATNVYQMLVESKIVCAYTSNEGFRVRGAMQAIYSAESELEADVHLSNECSRAAVLRVLP